MRISNDALLIPFLTIIFVRIVARVEANDKLEESKSHIFPPCTACRILVNSFKAGIDRTTREIFDGGDALWEHDNLGYYATSETRLIEIQEHLCKDVERGERQCHSLAEEFEHKIEDWWLNHQQTHPDLFEYICIQQTERCCPENHFGPDCSPCPGYPKNICSNNGRCKGAGTRTGDGQCSCDKDYAGDICSECASGYYESYRDKKKFLCSTCHFACNGPCKGPGPSNCEECSEGWYLTDDAGCVDVNECLENDETCPSNYFCVNKDGGVDCLSCDRACDGCTGDGPDMCTNCAEGFHKKGNICMNSDLLDRKQQENIRRYATYFGLCVATCIILQRNIYAASIIGLAVGVYISVSEYMLADNDNEDPIANVDIPEPA